MKTRSYTSRRVLAEEREKLGITEGTPTTGVAISGGGIRSAAFGLGLLQALMDRDRLAHVDYLSTVSGGGYIGAALTWFLRGSADGGGSPGDLKRHFRRLHAGKGDETNFVNYLQQHGSYLAPGRGLNLTSVLAVVLRSILVSVLIYFAFLLAGVSTLGLVAQLPAVDAAYGRLAAGLSKVHPSAASLIGDPAGAPGLAGQGARTPSARETTARVSWHERSLFRLSALLAAAAVIAFALTAGLFYLSIFVLHALPGFATGKYTLRNRFQALEGGILTALAIVLLLLTVPLAHGYLHGMMGPLAVFGYVCGVWGALAKLRQFMGSEEIFKRQWLGQLLFHLGALIFVYASLILAYHWSLVIVGVPISGDSGVAGHTYRTIAGILCTALVAGWALNINDATVGSMYRDRLMETFLPDETAVRRNRWQPADTANGVLLEEMCAAKAKRVCRPYHLINSNVILVKAGQKVYRRRGGDNFLLSPLYCGSDATKYVKTPTFMKNHPSEAGGLTLATAMATSGAAVNPHSGVSGSGPTRGRLVSLMMTVFNLRLGFWATNPERGAPRSRPNYIRPGLCSLLGCFGYSEKAKYIELSDGGHFENLGLYELVRRRVDTIIVSDGTADKAFSFGDLANAIERVRVDFGVRIRFEPEEDQLGELLPGSGADGSFADRFQLAGKGYACGTIYYPPRQEGDAVPAKRGRIILVKSTLLPDLPADLYGYKARHADFPDQSTGDQFFDENQFEAYRELGFHACRAALDEVFKPQVMKPAA